MAAPRSSGTLSSSTSSTATPSSTMADTGLIFPRRLHLCLLLILLLLCLSILLLHPPVIEEGVVLGDVNRGLLERHRQTTGAYNLVVSVPIFVHKMCFLDAVEVKCGWASAGAQVVEASDSKLLGEVGDKVTNGDMALTIFRAGGNVLPMTHHEDDQVGE